MLGSEGFPPKNSILTQIQVPVGLPAAEESYQSSQPAATRFLSEEMTARDVIPRGTNSSAFIEYIVVATYCGRSLSHRHQSLVNNTHPKATQDFWNRHNWISFTVTQRMEVFASRYPQVTQESNPLLLFTGLMWRTTKLYLCQTLKHAAQPLDTTGTSIAEHMMQDALRMAQEIVALAPCSTTLGCLKVRYNTPPVSPCAGQILQITYTSMAIQGSPIDANPPLVVWRVPLGIS